MLKHDSIALSDWIVVKNFDGIARVLEFKNTSAKTIAQGRIKVSAIDIEDKTYENVGFLLEYYIVKPNGELKLADVRDIKDTVFLSIKEYCVHVPPPDIDGNLKYVNQNICQQLAEYILINPSDSGFSKDFGNLSGKKDIKKETEKKQNKRKALESFEIDVENKENTQKKKINQQKKRKTAHTESDDEKKKKSQKKNINQQNKRKKKDEDSESDDEYRAFQNIKKRKRVPLQTINK